MREQPNRAASHDMEFLVSRILRIGLLVSLSFLAAGLLWRWLATGQLRFDYELPRTNVLQFMKEELGQVAAGSFRPRVCVNIGLAVLIFTPYLRVLASMLYFATVERNGKYTLFTGFVLATLTYSLFLR